MEINNDFVTTGLSLSADFKSGEVYEHHGYAIDAPEFIPAGSSWGIKYAGQQPYSVSNCAIRGFNAFLIP